jgi:hypothetical protein
VSCDIYKTSCTCKKNSRGVKFLNFRHKVIVPHVIVYVFWCTGMLAATQFKIFCLSVRHISKEIRDFRLPLRWKWDLCSSGMLRSLEWLLVTDVSCLKTEPICCPETSVSSYQSTLCTIPEVWRFQICTYYKYANCTFVCSFRGRRTCSVTHDRLHTLHLDDSSFGSHKIETGVCIHSPYRV